MVPPVVISYLQESLGVTESMNLCFPPRFPFPIVELFFCLLKDSSSVLGFAIVRQGNAGKCSRGAMAECYTGLQILNTWGRIGAELER